MTQLTRGRQVSDRSGGLDKGAVDDSMLPNAPNSAAIRVQERKSSHAMTPCDGRKGFVKMGADDQSSPGALKPQVIITRDL